MPAIPEEYIKKYVDELLEAAKSFGPNSRMGKSCLLRADTIMDLVKAWRETKDPRWKN